MLFRSDYSTLCRYRNWLAQDNTLSELLELINRQLTEKGLKVEKASAAVVDATIIQTAGSKQRQAIEVDEEGQVSGQTTPSKDSDARWIKKNGLYKLGYKQHTRTDTEGYIEKLHITPANAHECKHLSPLLEGLPKGTTVYGSYRVGLYQLVPHARLLGRPGTRLSGGKQGVLLYRD